MEKGDTNTKKRRTNIDVVGYNLNFKHMLVNN